MTSRMLRLLPLALLAATPAAAQTVRGKVLDAASGEPVAEAVVRALAPSGRDLGHARTKPDGGFQIQLRAAGSVQIQAERTGYHPTLTSELPVGVREDVQVEVRMSAAAVAVEPLRVTARVQPPHRRSLELSGFYDRERLGIGKYLRREDFERLPNANLAQVLSRAQGTMLVYQGAQQYITFPRSGPGIGCLPRLYVDGNVVTYDRQNDINAILSVQQIEAIEVFRGASEIPVQYNGLHSICGVILIWTRHEE